MIADVRDIAAERALVVKIAREWIGTKYQHGARIKGVCCDCTFPAEVYHEAGLIRPLQIRPYNSMAHLHLASSQYLNQVRKIAREIEQKDALPGDLAMFFIARDFSHSGIITEAGWPNLIHADMRAGAVLEARGDELLPRQDHVRAIKFFSLWA